MKATGIVRRIDDLGRVVIPKEIRRTLRLREGTPLEIFTDREGEIILKKYSPMMELTSFAVQYAEAMAQSTVNAIPCFPRRCLIRCGPCLYGNCFLWEALPSGRWKTWDYIPSGSWPAATWRCLSPIWEKNMQSSSTSMPMELTDS